MVSPPTRWIALRREVVAVSIDPATGRDVAPGLLPAGTLVEQPFAGSHEHVELRGELTVRTRDAVGRVGLERIRARVLLAALAPPRSAEWRQPPKRVAS
jgi:hypothetical protein